MRNICGTDLIDWCSVGRGYSSGPSKKYIIQNGLKLILADQ